MRSNGEQIETFAFRFFFLEKDLISLMSPLNFQISLKYVSNCAQIWQDTKVFYAFLHFQLSLVYNLVV